MSAISKQALARFFLMYEELLSRDTRIKELEQRNQELLVANNALLERARKADGWPPATRIIGKPLSELLEPNAAHVVPQATPRWDEC